VTHHWNWFDLTMLIPYFAVMIILSFYGITAIQCAIYISIQEELQPQPATSLQSAARE